MFLWGILRSLVKLFWLLAKLLSISHKTFVFSCESIVFPWKILCFFTPTSYYFHQNICEQMQSFSGITKSFFLFALSEHSFFGGLRYEKENTKALKCNFSFHLFFTIRGFVGFQLTPNKKIWLLARNQLRTTTLEVFIFYIKYNASLHASPYNLF